MAVDIGLTHIALASTNIAASVEFYARYAAMEIVHQRIDQESGKEVVWLSDRTRPFVLVLIEHETPDPVLKPFAHLGVGCSSKQKVDDLCDQARIEGILKMGPEDAGYPVGYWALISDPDGHSLELSFGQEVGLATESDEGDE